MTIGMGAALRRHWPEYLMEAAGLGGFMVSACLFTTLIEHPASPVRQMIVDATARRALVGLAMGATAIAVIYSPWGRRSGAHINPATTVTFYRLGRVDRWDAVFYAAAQFLGAATGVAVAALVLGGALADQAVRYAVTLPGMHGVAAAFAAEAAITALLMTAVLNTAASPRAAPYTGVLVGALVATYITVEAPLSGMSMNPARTLASALAAREWTALWIYFVAPAAGMLLAAQLFLALRTPRAVPCAKMRHVPGERCIFCDHVRARETRAAPAGDAARAPLTLLSRGERTTSRR